MDKFIEDGEYAVIQFPEIDKQFIDEIGFFFVDYSEEEKISAVRKTI